jgi:hypothetical protein
MSHTNYKGYTIVTQVAMLEDDTLRWRYKIYKAHPLTDYPSDLIYESAEQAEAAARREIDAWDKSPAAIADLLVAIEVDTTAFVKGLNALAKASIVIPNLSHISQTKDE